MNSPAPIRLPFRRMVTTRQRAFSPLARNSGSTKSCRLPTHRAALFAVQALNPQRHRPRTEDTAHGAGPRTERSHHDLGTTAIGVSDFGTPEGEGRRARGHPGTDRSRGSSADSPSGRPGRHYCGNVAIVSAPGAVGARQRPSGTPDSCPPPVTQTATASARR